MGKQLNLYIPDDKTDIVARARRYAEMSRVPLYSIVLQALADFLEHQAGEGPRFRTFPLGVRDANREGLYEERLDRKLAETRDGCIP